MTKIQIRVDKLESMIITRIRETKGLFSVTRNSHYFENHMIQFKKKKK